MLLDLYTPDKQEKYWNSYFDIIILIKAIDNIHSIGVAILICLKALDIICNKRKHDNFH